MNTFSLNFQFKQIDLKKAKLNFFWDHLPLKNAFECLVLTYVPPIFLPLAFNVKPKIYPLSRCCVKTANFQQDKSLQMALLWWILPIFERKNRSSKFWSFWREFWLYSIPPPESIRITPSNPMSRFSRGRAKKSPLSRALVKIHFGKSFWTCEKGTLNKNQSTSLCLFFSL